MRRKNWSTEPPVGDAASPFLLQFDEEPTFCLHSPQDRASSPDGAQRFDACVVTRTSDKELVNGSCCHDAPFKFVLHRGDYALLRPDDNATRPGVARIHAFMRASASKLIVRVQWFYRAEDLSERPHVAVGEDELFETLHFDDVQLVALVGRAHVNSYDVWERGCAERAHLRPPKPVPEVSSSDDDKGSNASSFFWDNFSESAVHYYCRYMYDPYGHLFVASRFENPDADPENDLAELREQANPDALDRDYKAVGVSIDDDDDDDDDNLDLDELAEEIDELSRKPTGKKRKRGPTSRPRGVSGVVESTGVREKAAQFCLPSDIGDGFDEPLPCRDEEKKHVRKFLTEAIGACAAGRDGGARCLYVSGVPGTGKTATIREELRTLRAKRASGEVAAFETLEINGMSVPDPHMVYSELLAAMTGNRRVAPAQAAALLEKRFSRGDGGGGNVRGDRRACVVLLLDEMDLLVSRAQKVLYDVLDWPTRPRSNLVIIGVANTMDLPERMLPRLASRLGLNRLSYPPYTKKQLEEILALRLPLLHKDVKFDAHTVTLCAAKVGAVSGDVRRALQLCRQSAELAREEAQDRKNTQVVVKATHLTAAVSLASGTARLAALEQLSRFEILTLIAAIVLVRAHGSFAMDETTSVQAVCEQAREIAAREKALFDCGSPNAEELEECVLRLENLRILLLERSSMLRNSRVIINLLVDDACFALRDDKLASKVLSV